MIVPPGMQGSHNLETACLLRSQGAAEWRPRRPGIVCLASLQPRTNQTQLVHSQSIRCPQVVHSWSTGSPIGVHKPYS